MAIRYIGYMQYRHPDFVKVFASYIWHWKPVYRSIINQMKISLKNSKIFADMKNTLYLCNRK